MKIILVLCIPAILFSCTESNSTEKQVVNPETEIREVWTQFIEYWQAEDASGCASLYDSDALNIPHAFEVNSGRDSIEQFYELLFSSNRSSRYQHRTEALYFNGDMAVEYATFQVDWISNEGEEWAYKARALVNWKKSESGDWLIRTMLFNNPPDTEVDSMAAL